MIAVAVIVVAMASLVAFSPLIHRDTRRRWETGKGAGLGSHWMPCGGRRWKTRTNSGRLQLEVPAPAPSPGDKGLDDGRIVIDLN